MQCRTCGAQVPPNAPVCMRCGTPISASIHAADQTMFGPSAQRAPFPQYPPTYQGHPPTYQGGPAQPPSSGFGNPQAQTPPPGFGNPQAQTPPPGFSAAPYQQSLSPVQRNFGAPPQQAPSFGQPGSYPSFGQLQGPGTYNNNQPGSSPYQGAAPYGNNQSGSSPYQQPQPSPNVFPSGQYGGSAFGQGPQQSAPFPGAAPSAPSYMRSSLPSGTSTQKKKSRLPQILIAIVVVVIICVVGGTLYLQSSGRSITSLTTPIDNSVPSGLTINPTAAAIITDAQTSSGVDATTFQPSSAHLTTSFKTKQQVYLSFKLNAAKYNVNKQPAYLLVKFYADGKSVIKKEQPYTITQPIDAAYFVAEYYVPTSNAAAEVYWCNKSDCSDRQLAQVLHFTISGS